MERSSPRQAEFPGSDSPHLHRSKSVDRKMLMFILNISGEASFRAKLKLPKSPHVGDFGLRGFDIPVWNIK